MSSLVCAISGTTPTEPVITRNGNVFEKALILKHLAISGTDPVTNEPLSEEELIPIKASVLVKPRPVAATSIPSLLLLFQSEWDAMMLESYSLRKQLDAVRQELSNSLYQHDAACRVIARLVKERDEARKASADARASVPQLAADRMDVEKQNGITAAIIETIETTSINLSRSRKKRTIAPTLATVEEVSRYKNVSSHPPHKASAPGITCLDIHPNNQLVITGGMDKTAVIFNRETRKIAHPPLVGHTKRLTEVMFHPTEDIFFTSSQDKTVKIWATNKGTGAIVCSHTIKSHTAEVTGFDLHPTGSFLVTSSLDKSWGFHDIGTGQTLAQINEKKCKCWIPLNQLPS